MRVLLLTKSLIKGGAATGARQLSQALSTAGADVVAVGAYEQAQGVRIRFLRSLERSLERAFLDAETHCLRLGRSSLDVREFYERHLPDVVQVCDISGNVVRMADFAEVPCPVVHRLSDFWPYHGPRHYALDPLESGNANAAGRWIYDRTIAPHLGLPDAITAPSSWLVENLRLPKDATVRVEHIKNAVAVPDPPRVGGGLRDRIRLGFIANPVLDRRKGFDSLNGALGVLERAGYDVEIHIFGRIRRAQRSAVGGVETHYHGTFGPAELSQVYSSFDILLCPSRLDNSPNVVCEALAWGCPVVGQTDTGVESYICENTGRLVDFGGFRQGASKARAEAAQEGLLRAISEIVKDFASFSTAASQYARRELAFDKIGTAYMRLYEELCEGMCPA